MSWLKQDYNNQAAQVNRVVHVRKGDHNPIVRRSTNKATLARRLVHQFST